MPVQKEWLCLAHGDFDGPEPGACPHGCGASMVQRVFRTAPALQSAGYRSVNASFEALAKDHGLTNMRNAPGEGMRRADAATHQRLARATEMVMGASRAGMTGQDAGQFFKPLREFQPGSTGDGGVVRRDEAGRVVSGQFNLGMPKPELVAAPFDGKHLGTPAGDA